MKFQNIALLVLLLLAKTGWAAVKLPAIFSDNMVLQSGQLLPVWGWAEPGENVQLVFKHKTYHAVTSREGKWAVKLDKYAAGGPYEMLVKGADNQIVIKNILIGEVWVASGQSNMERGMQTDVKNGYQINADDQEVRFFYVPMAKSLQPKPAIEATATALNGKWVVCTPEVMQQEWAWHGFSAVGYYFATELRRHLKVPVGMIGTYKGGTPAQAWISLAGLKKDADFNKNYIARHDSLVAGYEHSDKPDRDGGFGAPANLYNAMVNPIVPYAIKGVLWYQGESNGDRLNDAVNYARLFPQLILDWRNKWGQGNFPFLWVQLPGFREVAKTPSEGNWPWVREAQLKALSLPNTGMAVAIDLGETKDIHPKNKLDVGLRLALVARKVVYHEAIACSGPVYESMKIKNGQVYLNFKNTGKGFALSRTNVRKQNNEVPTVLKGFGIAGADGKFVWATAKIEKNQVVVFSDAVANPVAVRYNWADYPEGNLYNAEGLPASPFRTDNWPAK